MPVSADWGEAQKKTAGDLQGLAAKAGKMARISRRNKNGSGRQRPHGTTNATWPLKKEADENLPSLAVF